MFIQCEHILHNHKAIITPKKSSKIPGYEKQCDTHKMSKTQPQQLKVQRTGSK